MTAAERQNEIMRLETSGGQAFCILVHPALLPSPKEDGAQGRIIKPLSNDSPIPNGRHLGWIREVTSGDKRLWQSHRIRPWRMVLGNCQGGQSTEQLLGLGEHHLLIERWPASASREGFRAA